jgi:hypothetical protein
MRTRILVAILVLPMAIGCPADRSAEKTMRGSFIDLPPEMHRHASPALAVIGDLRAPESALHDREQDLYFISNVNGALLTVDNNGFISRVKPETMEVELKWIEGGRDGVTLDAPKGMAIVGDTLYVSDITAVRRFDRRTGAPLGEIELDGATLINDLTTDGKDVYVSDTGLLLGPGTTFFSTGTDSIWKISGDRAEKLVGTRELRNPNGIDYVDGKLRIVTFGAARLYELSDGSLKTVATLPRGQLDGLVHLPDGTPVISSWAGEGVYRESEPILAGIDAPADLGYDARRHRLLVPSSGTNQLTIHAIR